MSLLCLLAEVGDDWHMPDGPGQPGKWPLAFLSLSFLICFSFSIFLQLLGFIKNTKTFPEILKIIVGSVGIIPNSPHLNPELFGHLKYLIAFKCPNANTI